jgi:hypothetical protein
MSANVATMSGNSEKQGKSRENKGSTTSSRPVLGIAKAQKIGPPQAPIQTPSATRSATRDPDLDLVNGAWDKLPAAVRAGIVAMVKAATAAATTGNSASPHSTVT